MAHDQAHTDSPEEHDECITCDCQDCKNIQTHKARVREARQAMVDDTARMEDKENLLVVITADMQKAITMPKLPTKITFSHVKWSCLMKHLPHLLKMAKQLASYGMRQRREEKPVCMLPALT